MRSELNWPRGRDSVPIPALDPISPALSLSVATPLVLPPVQWRRDLQGASAAAAPAERFSRRRLMRRRRAANADGGAHIVHRRRHAGVADQGGTALPREPAPAAAPSLRPCQCGRRHRRRPVPCAPTRAAATAPTTGSAAAATPPPVLACSFASLLACSFASLLTC